MKHLLKYLLAAAALLLWGQAAAAGPFGQLRGLCEPGKSVLLTAPTVVEGIVVSDYRSPNMELNPNLNYYSVDLEENDRTVYVEAADGSCGSSRERFLCIVAISLFIKKVAALRPQPSDYQNDRKARRPYICCWIRPIYFCMSRASMLAG